MIILSISDNQTYSGNSLAVQAHLNIMQAVIHRMASNSASCKAWCITIVSAILVLVVDKGESKYALIAGIPTLLFLVLDAYYLGLERSFRNSYNQFIEKIHIGNVSSMDLFSITPEEPNIIVVFKSMCSFPIWAFYLTLGIMIILEMLIVFPS